MRPSRPIASRYRLAAVSPSLSSARERASTPSPKSVPPARMTSASRSSAVPECAFPLRTAASINSGSAHIEIYSAEVSSLACVAAASASSYRPRPLAKMAAVQRA